MLLTFVMPANSDKIQIQDFTWSELDQLLSLARKFHEESWFKCIQLSEHRIVDFLLHAKASRDSRYFRIAMLNGRLIGALYGHIGQYWFAEEDAAFVDFIFVAQKFRGSRAALLLWSDWMVWVKRKNVKEVTQIISTGIGQAASKKFFEKLGLTTQGHVLKGRIAEL